MPRKSEPTLSIDQRRWLNTEQAAEWVGKSKEFFAERVQPYIPFLPWGESKNSPISYDKQDIDKLLEQMKHKPIKQLQQ